MSKLVHSCVAAVLLAIPAVLSGCDEYLFDEQEIRVRHDAAHDTLDLLLIEHGITAVDGEEHLDRACKDFVKFAREPGVIGPVWIEWPLNLAFDLDAASSPAADASGKEKAGEKESDADWLQIRPSITVVGKGLFLDELRRLAAWSHVRVTHVKEVVAIANRMYARTLEGDATRELAELDARKADGRSPDPAATDRATLEAQLAKVRAGTNFFEWRDGSFVVERPMSRARKDREVREFALEIAGAKASLDQTPLERRNEAWGDAWCVASLGAQLRRYEYEGGVLRMVFGEAGRFEHSARRGNVHYEAKLLDRLVADKIPVDAGCDDRRIIAEFEQSLAADH